MKNLRTKANLLGLFPFASWVGVWFVLWCVALSGSAWGDWEMYPYVMNKARGQATLTDLQDGNWLIAGGYNGDTGTYYADCEVMDPKTGKSQHTGSMTQSRAGHQATRLPTARSSSRGDTITRAGAGARTTPTCRTAKSMTPKAAHGRSPIPFPRPGPATGC
jgi:hypothetical protein